MNVNDFIGSVMQLREEQDTFKPVAGSKGLFRPATPEQIANRDPLMGNPFELYDTDISTASPRQLARVKQATADIAALVKKGTEYYDSKGYASELNKLLNSYGDLGANDTVSREAIYAYSKSIGKPVKNMFIEENVVEAGLFKPASPEQVRQRGDEVYGRLAMEHFGQKTIALIKGIEKALGELDLEVLIDTKMFAPYCENGKAVEVQFSDGNVQRGTVTVTRSLNPSFGLVIDKATGDGYYLQKSDRILRELPESIKEAGLFKPASPSQLQAREDEEGAREAQRIAELGPKFQQLKTLMVEIRELEREYTDLTEDRYRLHGEAGRGRGSYGYYGPGADWISYNIKVSHYNRTPLSDICQQHGMEEALWEAERDQYNQTLTSFVGEEKYWGRDKTTGKSVETVTDTGGGIKADYPDLFSEWTQTGGNGGYLTLHLSDIGWEDMDTIFGTVERAEKQDGTYDIETVEEDLEYAVDYKAKITKRMQDIEAVANDVKETVAHLVTYLESVEFGNDFFENEGYNREDDEDFMEALKQWQAFTTPKVKKVRKPVVHEAGLFKPASPEQLRNRSNGLSELINELITKCDGAFEGMKQNLKRLQLHTQSGQPGSRTMVVDTLARMWVETIRLEKTEFNGYWHTVMHELEEEIGLTRSESQELDQVARMRREQSDESVSHGT